jgi:hypothetical protein
MYPAEALFRSLAIMQPQLSMRNFDLVTDRNCLRKILRFVLGDVEQPFRIDILAQGDVVFLCRWEAELKQIILGHQNTGYGHSFEKATTSFDKTLRDSSGHHRVVRYSLGDLRCLVRYEADGCIEDVGENTETKAEGGNDADDLLDALKAMSIVSPRVEVTGTMQVRHQGRVVPPSTLLEIKTRTVYLGLSLDKVIPQLWFAQTPNLFVGFHKKGEFQQVRKLSMESAFEQWEERHQAHLMKFVVLLKKLGELAKNAQKKRCTVICEGEKMSPRIKIYESNKMGAVLPEDIINMHEWAKEMKEAVAESERA